VEYTREHGAVKADRIRMLIVSLSSFMALTAESNKDFLLKMGHAHKCITATETSKLDPKEIDDKDITLDCFLKAKNLSQTDISGTPYTAAVSHLSPEFVQTPTSE